MNHLLQLQEWYESQCNGDWEHSYGISIGTLDNPGWLVEIDLTETSQYGVHFVELQRGDCERDSDWISCKVTDSKFTGTGGARNLEEILDAFLSWANCNTNNAA